jgi:hypothetical protein
MEEEKYRDIKTEDDEDCCLFQISAVIYVRKWDHPVQSFKKIRGTFYSNYKFDIVRSHVFAFEMAPATNK